MKNLSCNGHPHWAENKNQAGQQGQGASAIIVCTTLLDTVLHPGQKKALESNAIGIKGVLFSFPK